MNLTRQKSRRLSVLGIAAATALVASCDTTVSFRPDELLWGFVTVAAQKTTAGDLRTAPSAVFFRGAVTTVPSAGVRPDSCFPAQDYVPPTNNFTGVTYLDAGASLGLTLGTNTTELARSSSGGVTTYGLASGTTIPYRPGDSIVVRVPGANGGYPTTEVRAKTADAFTMQTVTPQNVGYLQLRWTPAPDTNSAIVLQLQFAPAGGSGAITREIRCAFRDDGVDSVALTQYQLWGVATNLKREVVATRLRTLLRNVNGGAMQFISTYQIPTPSQ